MHGCTPCHLLSIVSGVKKEKVLFDICTRYLIDLIGSNRFGEMGSAGLTKGHACVSVGGGGGESELVRERKKAGGVREWLCHMKSL